MVPSFQIFFFSFIKYEQILVLLPDNKYLTPHSVTSHNFSPDSCLLYINWLLLQAYPCILMYNFYVYKAHIKLEANTAGIGIPTYHHYHLYLSLNDPIFSSSRMHWNCLIKSTYRDIIFSNLMTIFSPNFKKWILPLRYWFPSQFDKNVFNSMGTIYYVIMVNMDFKHVGEGLNFAVS